MKWRAGALVLLIAAFVSQYASPHPDGLESVADSQGFADAAVDSPTSGWWLADYSLQGGLEPWIGAAIAGLVGCVVCLVVTRLVTVNADLIPDGSKRKSAVHKLSASGGATTRPTRNNRKAD